MSDSPMAYKSAIEILDIGGVLVVVGLVSDRLSVHYTVC